MFSRQLEGDHYYYTYILCCLLAQRDFSEILQTAAYNRALPELIKLRVLGR